MDDSYMMGHQPNEDGAPLHDVESHFPDFHERPELYTDRLPPVSEANGITHQYRQHLARQNSESVNAIKAAKGKPDSLVTIYRGMPQEHIDAAHAAGEHPIQPGNWVSLSKAYAQGHGFDAEDPDKDWPVVSKTVPAKHVRTPGDSIHEWGYFPE